MKQMREVGRPLARLSGLAALAALAGLSACGGGGSASDPAPQASPLVAISSSNYQAVTQSTVAGALFLQSSGDVLGNPSAARAGALLQQGSQLGRKALLSSAREMSVRPVAEQQTTVACSQGGSLRVTLSDLNNNNQFDVGDSIVVEALGCKEAGETMTGRLAMTVSSASGVFGSTNFTVGLTMTMSAFSVTSSAGSSVGDGTLSMVMSASPNGTVDLSLNTARLSLSATAGGLSSTETLSDAHFSAHAEVVGTQVRTTLQVDGTLASTAFDGKQVRFSTPVPWLALGNDRFPSSGQLLIRGDAGSQARLTILNNAQVRIELDANGDGVYETSVVKAWTELH
jgi:hypothetical protein